MAAVSASFTILFLSAGLVLSAASFGTMSNYYYCYTLPAKCQANFEHITPLPRTATFLMLLFDIQ